MIRLKKPELPLKDFQPMVTENEIKEYQKFNKLDEFTLLFITPKMAKLKLPSKCTLMFARIVKCLIHGQACYKNKEYFAKEFNLTKRTIKKYMEILVKGKYIKVIYNNQNNPYYVKNLPTNKIIAIGFDTSKVF